MIIITTSTSSTKSTSRLSWAAVYTCTAFVLAVFIAHQSTPVCGKEMLVKTGGKKGSLIIMGKKCVPTLIKSGGKRGKDIIIIGDNSNCGGHKQQAHYTPQYIPVPVYHQTQHYYPKVEHQYSYHDATPAAYGHGGHGGGHMMSYDQGYGHLLGGDYAGGSLEDYGAY